MPESYTHVHVGPSHSKRCAIPGFVEMFIAIGTARLDAHQCAKESSLILRTLPRYIGFSSGLAVYASVFLCLVPFPKGTA